MEATTQKRKSWQDALQGESGPATFLRTQGKVFFLIFAVSFCMLCWLYFLYMMSHPAKTASNQEKPAPAPQAQQMTPTMVRSDATAPVASPGNPFGAPRADMPYNSGGSLTSTGWHAPASAPAAWSASSPQSTYGAPAAYPAGAPASVPYAPQYGRNSSGGLHDLTLPRSYRHSQMMAAQEGRAQEPPRLKMVISR